MPTFRYYQNDRLHFQCKLDCERCTAHTHGGRQCRRRTCKYLPMCWQHMKLAAHLTIKPSRIRGAGLGIFAWDPRIPRTQPIFRRGQRVTPANTRFEVLTDAQLHQRYGAGLDYVAPYAFQLGARGHRYGDWACRRDVAGYANHRPAARRQNARISKRGRLLATKSIRHGDEILVSYGRTYWRRGGGGSSSSSSEARDGHRTS